MVYITENWKLSDYEKAFTSQGSIDIYYPKVIIQNHLREGLLGDLIKMFGVEHTSQIIVLLNERFKN